MMRIPVRRHLLWFLWRATWPWSLVAPVVAAFFSLLAPEPFVEQQGAIALFVVVHCFAIVLSLGKAAPEARSWLRARGIAPWVLWGHTILASALSVAAALVPAALIVASGLRGAYLNATQAPWYPLMTPVDLAVIARVAALYALLLPPLHFAGFRNEAAGRGRAAGAHLGLAGVILTFCCIGIVNPTIPNFVTRPEVVWAAAIAAALFLWLGAACYRRMEAPR